MRTRAAGRHLLAGLRKLALRIVFYFPMYSSAPTYLTFRVALTHESISGELYREQGRCHVARLLLALGLGRICNDKDDPAYEKVYSLS
jgi:hypothetical protein